MRKGAAGGIMKIVIFGFLMMAVGGMVLMDVGGFFRSGGVGSADVAKIAGEKISLPAFDRTVRRQLSQLGIAPNDAYKAGYIDQILGSEVRNRLLAKAGSDLGIVIDNKRVAKQIRSLMGPMVQPGQDPKEALRQILMNQNMSEGDLTRAISHEIQVGLLNDTIEGGFTDVPDDLAADLFAFEQETRDVVYIPFLDSELTTSVEPGDEQLQSLYNSIKEAAYATPETRELKLVRLKTDAIKKTIQIDEQEIRDAYDESIDLYSEKEQRVVEQSMFSDEARAQEVADKVKAGTSLEKATASQSDYLGERPFEAEALPDGIKEQVLAAKKGDILGPIKTSIGYQVVVLKGITPAQTKSFDSVKKEIRDELVETRIIDQQYELAGMVDDRLAGGASLEDVKKDVEIEVIDLPAMNPYGQDKSGGDALKAHEKARDFVLQNGFSLQEGETSPMTELADGSFVAVHVQSVQPKTYKPFEEVRGEMLKKWMQDQRNLENKMQAMEIVKDAEAREVSAQSVAEARKKALKYANNISRKNKPPAPFLERSWGNIFEARPGHPFIVDIEGGAAVAWVVKAELPKSVDTDSAEFREFKTRLADATRTEAMLQYGEDKRVEYGAAVNQKLLERAYGQSPDATN